MALVANGGFSILGVKVTPSDAASFRYDRQGGSKTPVQGKASNNNQQRLDRSAGNKVINRFAANNFTIPPTFDVNNDKSINGLDVKFLADVLAGNAECSPDVNCDVNGDGQGPDAQDLVVLANYVREHREPVPYSAQYDVFPPGHPDGRLDLNDYDLIRDMVVGNTPCTLSGGCDSNSFVRLSSFVADRYDMNGDRKINNDDIIMLQDVLSGKYSCYAGPERCDVNGDGQGPNAQDGVLLANAVKKLNNQEY